MEPDHPIVVLRLAGVFLCALPAVRELYQYINHPRYRPFYPPSFCELSEINVVGLQ